MILFVSLFRHLAFTACISMIVLAFAAGLTYTTYPRDVIACKYFRRVARIYAVTVTIDLGMSGVYISYLCCHSESAAGSSHRARVFRYV